MGNTNDEDARKRASREFQDDTLPMTLAESIRRKIAEMQAIAVEEPAVESGEASGAQRDADASIFPLGDSDSHFELSRNKHEEGSVLGNYDLLTLIHSGSMARIFVAQHQLMGRRVAAKVLQSEQVQSTFMVKRLQEESRALSRLKCPHVIDIHDFGISIAGYPYIIMELLEVPNLEELIKSKGRLAEMHSMQIIEQIAQAFNAAHESAIKYGNLKPAHVLVEEISQDEVRIKLIDFSGACLEQGLPPLEPSLDLAPYMSPEQFSGAPLQVQSDIYSLACLTFEMLTGTPPFVAKSLPDYSQAHSEKQPQKVDSVVVSDQVYNVLFKAMEKDPGRRHQTVNEFVTELKSALLCKK